MNKEALQMVKQGNYNTKVMPLGSKLELGVLSVLVGQSYMSMSLYKFVQLLTLILAKK